MMNLVFNYKLKDFFINSFDFNKLSSMEGTVDVDELWRKAVNENPGKECIGTWCYDYRRNSKNNTKHHLFTDVFDSNNLLLDKYKNEPMFYQIDMFGGANLAFPDIIDGYAENTDTVIDFIPHNVLDAIKKNKNFVILIDYLWEGIFPFHNLKRLHNKLHQYKIPTNQCILSFAGYNQSDWYETFCDKYNISQKIHLYHNHWVWKTKGEEFSEYMKEEEFDKINFEYKVEKKKYDFNCLNRRLRTHRLYVLAKLNQMNLIDNNIVTYDFTIEENRPHLKEVPDIENNQDLFDFKDLKKYLIDLQINKDKKLYDFDNLQNLHGIQHESSDVYKNSMFTFVTETSYLEGEFYISEKVVKAIGQNHPFIVFGNYGTLKELKRLGFKTFEPFIDESYDSEKNVQKRIDLIFDEINKLVNKSDEEKLKWMSDIQSIVYHNSDLLQKMWFGYGKYKLNMEDDLKRLASNYLI